MRALFIGNSYVVAIKDGLDLIQSPFGESPSFLIAPGSELDVEVAQGQIVPKAARTQIVSPQGSDVRALPIEEFDVFVTVGLGVSPGQCTRLFRSCGIFGYSDDGRRMLSRAAFTNAVRGLLLETPAYQIAKAIRTTSNKPVLIVTQPMPPTRVRSADLKSTRHQEIFDRWSAMFEEPAHGEFYAMYLTAALTGAQEIGVTFVEQAEETRDLILSKDEYQATVRINFFRKVPDRQNEIEDFSHLNGAYGAIMLKAMERALQS